MQHEQVQEYYGKTLQTTEDLKTNACCDPSSVDARVKKISKLIHDEVSSKYYGCGLIVPSNLEGARILDLGSGAGRDVYILSSLVGQNGSVVGVDMTKEQINVAKKHIDYHTKQFGFQKPNVEFHLGLIEELSELKFEEKSFDVVVSNCVINLCPDKEAVFREAFRVLKQGGELYFSDVYADRRVPEALTRDPVLWGECLTGALYWNDFIQLAKKAGFKDVRLVTSRPLTVENAAIQKKLGDIKFYSATYRLFKLDNLESDCEDYGQAVIYKGGVEEFPTSFTLDNHHNFPVKKVIPVCGNTFDMLNCTRFKPYFEFIGDRSVHFGIFPDCGKSMPFDTEGQCGPKGQCAPKGGSCC